MDSDLVTQLQYSAKEGQERQDEETSGTTQTATLHIVTVKEDEKAEIETTSTSDIVKAAEEPKCARCGRRKAHMTEFGERSKFESWRRFPTCVDCANGFMFVL
ncbi:hypothetical protein CALCODRAFT_485874 [Calocera cornea HHB12733]|uniref:Uncharacterized protein n=1 Tax=Calocera cornea HHB12733 TaxID=1353952 RepID=A0A165E3Q3_9BASI|nr:hypothetical protein CALCODRAFT_485874 [Calocera cornea HHB12733]